MSEIWYQVINTDGSPRRPMVLDGLPIQRIDILLEAIKAKSQLDAPPDMLNVYVKKSSTNQEEELTGTLLKAHTNFTNLIGTYDITEDNPIIVRLPSAATRPAAQARLRTGVEKAFGVKFTQTHDYLSKLDEEIDTVGNDLSFYNYLTIVQSSGYGKTRAAHELARRRPLIYVCFREDGSTGHPSATPNSMSMLKELTVDNVDDAAGIAMKWLQSMIVVFDEMYPEETLSDPKREGEFWKKVLEKRRQVYELNEEGGYEAERAERRDLPDKREEPFSPRMRLIVIFFDEASYLIKNGNKSPFRALRRALLEYRKFCFGIFTDTNSSVAELAPVQEMDTSLREGHHKVSRPFIYIATADCLSETVKVLFENGYDIVRFGRPLWGSLWTGKNDLDDDKKFQDIIRLAVDKLCGGTSTHQMTQQVALAVIACIAVLYVFPTSSKAPELVKSYMATLVAIDDDRKRHVITYPSEPPLSEAALELLSEEGNELNALTKLESVLKSGGILDAGNQGELVARLLFVSAWRRLIFSVREKEKRKVSFSVRRPLLDFLKELFGPKFQEAKLLPCLGDYDIGFTHFLAVNYEPNLQTVEAIWERRGALQFRRNQKGVDFGLIIKHKTKGTFGVVQVQVKNYATQQSSSKEEEHAYDGLSPDISFDCEFEDLLGISLHIGSAYDKSTAIIPKRYYSEESALRDGRARTLWYFGDPTEGQANRLLVHGLNSFKFTSTTHLDTFKSLLCARDDPTVVCGADNVESTLWMIPFGYAPLERKQKRPGEDKGDGDEGEGSSETKKSKKMKGRRN